MKWSTRLYERTLKAASHRQAPAFLGGLSFTEAIFLPIPPDLLLIPMVLANQSKAWYFAAVTTITSVLGGLIGYLIGVYLYDSVGAWVIQLYGLEVQFQSLKKWYDEYGIWVVLVSGFLPIPYKVFTIASGVFALSLFPFIIGSIIGRGARFFGVSAICYWAGDSVDHIMRKYATPAGWLITILVVLLIVYFTLR